MSKEENIAAQEKFAEGVNSGDLDVVFEVMSDDIVDHDPAPDQGPGPRGFKDFFETLRAAFPDLEVTPSEGALPYERVLGEVPYVEYIARSAFVAGAGRSGPVGEAEAYLFDARGLVEHAVGWIERNFPSGGSTDLG